MKHKDHLHEEFMSDIHNLWFNCCAANYFFTLDFSIDFSIIELKYLVPILYDTIFYNQTHLWVFNLVNIVYDYDIFDEILDNGERELLGGIPLIVSSYFWSCCFSFIFNNHM